MTMTQKSEQKESEQHFFDFAAEIGLTKHMGGLKATEELIELCRIGEGSYVLDVGCGAGQTACYIAKTHGCSVMGVDISERMVERQSRVQGCRRAGPPLRGRHLRCRHNGVRDRLPGGQAEGRERVCEGDEAGRIRRAQRVDLAQSTAPAGDGCMGVPGPGRSREAPDP